MRFPSPLTSAVLAGLMLLVGSTAALAQNAKAVGTVKSVSGKLARISTDDGQELTVVFQDSTRILRVSAAQPDLKDAPSVSISEVQVGDRLLARGQAGADGGLTASSVILMKKTDLTERRRQEQADWRRGVGGIVKEVDLKSSSISIANAFEASGKPVVIHVSPGTIIRRYSADSVKFEDSKPGNLDEIRPGDQLRARGTRNTERTEFSAQAIVSGTFRAIAGTVISVDPAANSITLMDLTAKTPVTVKVSADSELRRLPPLVARMIATRVQGGDTAASPAGEAGGSASPVESPRSNQKPEQTVSGARAGGVGETRWAANGGAEGNGRERGPDLQQMLGRLPAITLSDFEKGEAVMLVANPGTGSSPPTAIKVLAGVEPILTAAPSPSSASSILSPWNLGSAGAGGGDATTQ